MFKVTNGIQYFFSCSFLHVRVLKQGKKFLLYGFLIQVCKLLTLKIHINADFFLTTFLLKESVLGIYTLLQTWLKNLYRKWKPILLLFDFPAVLYMKLIFHIYLSIAEVSWRSIPSRHLLAQSDPWRYQNNFWKLVSLLLAWTDFIHCSCYKCWLGKKKHGFHNRRLFCVGHTQVR